MRSECGFGVCRTNRGSRTSNVLDGQAGKRILIEEGHNQGRHVMSLDMPRQLPGLYWHTDTRRYFPFPQTTTTTTTNTGSNPSSPYRALSHLRSALRTAHKDTLIQSVLFLLQHRS